MIETLHIKNFQVFEDIEIKGLCRVNLIAGKNNSGKTAMLEALRILAASGESTVVNHILKRRGQYKQFDQAYLSLYNRKYLAKKTDRDNKQLSINKLFIEKIATKATFNVFIDGNLSSELRINSLPDYPNDGAVYVPFGADLANTRELWDKIVLTPKEDEVFRIISETVEPRLIRLDFSSENVKVRLAGEEYPVPLQSLGDGVQRMLMLAIAMVSAKGKMLLIDEFEAGLHHSVQKKLWEMVFHYAKELDIQLFVTTHSEDTVRSFYYVASLQENEKEAAFLRLQFDRTGKHEAQVYDMERLGQSLELHLETR
ncbi:MAG: AAA family ATPase [Bacteroidetes bacterium]|nr:AAA family ATPase [Bacteroidota bacterium]